MTSSLVGSEMCIRDSSKARKLGRNRAFQDVASGLGPSKARNLGETGPVSYTHLTLPTICSV
eukprot:11417786-Prorocentrum_lima.AAC.1